MVQLKDIFEMEDLNGIVFRMISLTDLMRLGATCHSLRDITQSWVRTELDRDWLRYGHHLKDVAQKLPLAIRNKYGFYSDVVAIAKHDPGPLELDAARAVSVTLSEPLLAMDLSPWIPVFHCAKSLRVAVSTSGQVRALIELTPWLDELDIIVSPHVRVHSGDVVVDLQDSPAKSNLTRLSVDHRFDVHLNLRNLPRLRCLQGRYSNLLSLDYVPPQLVHMDLCLPNQTTEHEISEFLKSHVQVESVTVFCNTTKPAYIKTIFALNPHLIKCNFQTITTKESMYNCYRQKDRTRQLYVEHLDGLDQNVVDATEWLPVDVQTVHVQNSTCHVRIDAFPRLRAIEFQSHFYHALLGPNMPSLTTLRTSSSVDTIDMRQTRHLALGRADGNTVRLVNTLSLRTLRMSITRMQLLDLKLNVTSLHRLKLLLWMDDTTLPGGNEPCRIGHLPCLRVLVITRSYCSGCCHYLIDIDVSQLHALTDIYSNCRVHVVGNEQRRVNVWAQ
jgi:hypothetical protein